MKNHIILAMSTLPANIKKSTFSFIKEDGKEIVIEDCKSQLEPIPRLMMQMSDENDEFIIYALCSTATMAKPDDKNKVYDDNKEVTISAWDYFKERIKAYNNNVKYKEIKLDNLSNPYQAIAEVINSVRENYKESEDRLWVDTHGGLRDIAQIFSALISLLKVDNIVPDEIFGVEFGKNLIISQKEAFNIFEYVSGMNDFINFGSAEVLKKYYEGKKNKNVEEILNAMDEIAEGTQLCDPDKYTNGIKDLRESIKDIEDEPLLGIFAEYIKRDYGEELIPKEPSKKDAQIPPLAIIERCLNKGLYQQALTFLESMMPEEYVNSKCIYAEENVLETVTRSRKDNQWYLTDEHYLFDTYLRQIEFEGDEENRSNKGWKSWKVRWNEQKREEERIPKGKPLESAICAIEILSKAYWLSNNSSNMDNYIINTPKMFKKYSLPEEDVCEAFKVIMPVKEEVKQGNKIKKLKRNNEVQIELKTKFRDDELVIFMRLLQIHKALKQCRNLFNHSNSNRPSIENIKNVLKLYIIFAKHVLQESER